MNPVIDPSLEGRCGSCSLFVEDYGDAKATYGHCGRKPRIGSASGRDYKCEDYRMRPDLRRQLEQQAGQREAPAPHARPADGRPVRREPVVRATDDEPQRPGAPAAVTAAPTAPAAPQAAAPAAFPASRAPSAAPAPRPADPDGLRAVIADALDDLLGLSEVHLGDRWTGGLLVLRPANPSLQEKTIEIERFWHKLTMLREQLRNLERAVNNHPKLDEAEKIELQQYLTRCYGSLTTFNVLFRDKDAWFRGQKRDD